MDQLLIQLQSAPDVWEWIKRDIFAKSGSIHYKDHAHLLDADIQVTWASSSAAEAVGMLKKRDTATGGPVRMLVSRRVAGAC